MRARAFALRDLFADVLGGLYLREEIEEDRRSAPEPAGSVIDGELTEAAPQIASTISAEQAEGIKALIVETAADLPKFLS